MTDSISTSPLDSAADTAELRSQLRSGSEKTQLQLLQQQIADSGWDVLMEFLLERKSEPATAVMGKAYQILYSANSPRAAEFLQANFPTGLVPLRSDSNIDYTPLQQLLALQEFQEADRLTLDKLCELAGDTASVRKWLYFTQVESLPWRICKQLIRCGKFIPKANLAFRCSGKFGSVRGRIGISCGR
jgi:GUN4-like.